MGLAGKGGAGPEPSGPAAARTECAPYLPRLTHCRRARICFATGPRIDETKGGMLEELSGQLTVRSHVIESKI